MIKEKKTSTWESDCELAAQIANKLQIAQLKNDIDEIARILDENTADEITTLHYPPIPSRDGTGSKRIILDLDYQADKKIQESRTPKDGIDIRRREYSAVGTAIRMDEYRVYPLPDKRLIEIKAMKVMPVYNGKIIGYYAWSPVLPEEFIKMKQRNSNVSSDNEQKDLLDKTDIPYYQ